MFSAAPTVRSAVVTMRAQWSNDADIWCAMRSDEVRFQAAAVYFLEMP